MVFLFGNALTCSSTLSEETSVMHTVFLIALYVHSQFVMYKKVVLVLCSHYVLSVTKK
jgi:hypothetical protein